MILKYDLENNNYFNYGVNIFIFLEIIMNIYLVIKSKKTIYKIYEER